MRDILYVDTEKMIVRTEPLVDMRCVRNLCGTFKHLL